MTSLLAWQWPRLAERIVEGGDQTAVLKPNKVNLDGVSGYQLSAN